MLKLDLNLLWTVVDVLILYVLLRKFLFKPIQNMTENSLAHAMRHSARAESATEKDRG